MRLNSCRYRAVLRLPDDGFQLSSGYTTYAGKRCVFTWNKDRFPDPPAFFQALRERGVEVSPNVKPALLLMHPLLPALQENDIFVRDPVQEKPSVGAWWGGRGVFVDFTDPHARTVWESAAARACAGKRNNLCLERQL